MMKTWGIILRVLIFLIGGIVIAFNAQLYIYCKQQRVELNSIKDKLDVEAEFNSNKFKFEQDQMDHLSKNLEDTQKQVRAQKDALADQKDVLQQEADKREQIENENKDIQTSLVDIKAEADAIKQEMKGWQKDYVSVLAELEKKMDASQNEMKHLEDNLVALNIPELKENIKSLKDDFDKMNPPAQVALPDPPSSPEKKIEHDHLESQ